MIENIDKHLKPKEEKKVESKQRSIFSEQTKNEPKIQKEEIKVESKQRPIFDVENQSSKSM